MSEQTPSVGRIVHYVSHGTPIREDGTQAYEPKCRAAIVTAVPAYPEGSDANGNMLSLAVLNPSGLFFDLEVPYSDDTRVGGTWHWPERV